MTSNVRSEVVTRLFDMYFERVYCFARRFVDPSTAEDVAQQVFLRLLECKDLEQKEIHVSYVLKMAHNLIRRRARRDATADRINGDLAQCLVEGAAGGEAMGETESGPSTDAFRMLPRVEQDAVRLTVCEGLSYQEAAAAMEVRVSTLNNWKHRGMQRLKEALGRIEASPN